MAKKKDSSTGLSLPKKTSSSWQPSLVSGSRYIFFKSFGEDYHSAAYGSSGGHGIVAHFDFKSQMVKHAQNSKNQSYNEYIQEYIATMEELAQNERANEMRYINALNKDGIIQLSDFQDSDGYFDYIKFIKLLNELTQGTKLLQQNIQTNRANFKTILQALHNPQIKKTDTSKTEEELKAEIQKELTEAYLFYYDEYKKKMSKQLPEGLSETLTTLLTQRIREAFIALGRNAHMVQQLQQNLMYHTGNITEVLQDWCVEYVRQTIIQDESKITEAITINKDLMNTDDLSKVLQESLNRAYHNVVSYAQNIVEEILNYALSKHQDVANAIINSPGGDGGETTYQELLRALGVRKGDPLESMLNELKDNIKNIDDPNGAAMTRWNTRGKKIQSTSFDEYKKRLIAKYKGDFTKKLTAAIKEILLQKYPNANLDDEQIRKDIITQWYLEACIKNANTIAQQIAQRLSISSASSHEVAEILASPDFFNDEIKKVIKNIFIPGSKIQLKNDVVFTVSMAGLSPEELIPKGGHITRAFSRKASTVKKLIDEQGQRFLKRYKILGKNTTSVESASEAYLETMRMTVQRKNELLDQIDSGAEALNDYFNSYLNGSISVKDYKFYNDDYGYHMGSMGGSGKVVNAVPNIVKMLELGGITVPDAELIIQCLLNCFPDSLIGTSPLEDIKSLLIGGAAMMLFDDGFANATAFLQRVKTDLAENGIESSGSVGGNSLHLLYLNNIYIPQSYVLFNIVANVKTLFQDIQEQTSKPTSAADQMKMADTKSSLELHNPLTYSMYEDSIRNNPAYETRAAKWDAVSQIAQENVTIHFMFMAGMLDLMEKLAASFNAI